MITLGRGREIGTAVELLPLAAVSSKVRRLQDRTAAVSPATLEPEVEATQVLRRARGLSPQSNLYAGGIAAMRIRLDEPSLADELLRALSRRSNCLVECVGDRELEAVLVGSYRDAGRAELARFTEAWLDRRRRKSLLRLVA
jgi:hypothetical protein